MVTSRDVARVAGVSQATVSRVLQASAKVQPETRQKVLAAMDQVGYRPHAAARAMRTRRTGAIGVVVSDITNPFYPLLLEAVAAELHQAEQRMILWNDTGSGERAALEAIRDRTVDGVLFTSVVPRSRPLTEALHLEEPVVLLHRGLDDVSCDQVTHDNLAGGRLVAEYLAAAGHRRIAYLAGPELVTTSVHREEGFRQGLRTAGIELDDELYVRSGFAHDPARAATRELLQRPAPPTAIACANDLAALGALDGARSLGVQVPEDLWIVGYDDIPMASWDAFDLTTVRQPIAEMSAAAVTMLMSRIADRTAAPRTQRFPSYLVVRGSTAHAQAP